MTYGTMDKAAEAVVPDDIRRNKQSRRDGRRVGRQESRVRNKESRLKCNGRRKKISEVIGVKSEMIIMVR